MCQGATVHLFFCLPSTIPFFSNQRRSNLTPAISPIAMKTATLRPFPGSQHSTDHTSFLSSFHQTPSFATSHPKKKQAVISITPTRPSSTLPLPLVFLFSFLLLLLEHWNTHSFGVSQDLVGLFNVQFVFDHASTYTRWAFVEAWFARIVDIEIWVTGCFCLWCVCVYHGFFLHFSTGVVLLGGFGGIALGGALFF